MFSYDLGEISGFVENNPSYANKMLLDVLGEDNISNIYYYSSYGNDSKYWSAQGLVNTGNADRLPDIPLYAVVIVIYILVVGPGLYLLLKKKDMSRYYGTSVVICSIAASFVFICTFSFRFINLGESELILSVPCKMHFPFM